MKRFSSLFLCALFVLTFSFANINAQFTINDLLKVRRVGDPQLSPDGKWVAFTIGDVNKEANRIVTQIYLISIDGGEPKQITSGDRSSSQPRWSPDGKRIAFVTGGQTWTMNADGSDRKQVTTISTGASGPVWSPDGKMIAFSSEIYPECNGDDACNKREDEKVENSKVQAKVSERLLFRHWVEWRDRKRTHVFIVSSDGGNVRDLTPGDFDSPPYAASTGVDYAFSPDSKEIAFLRNPDKVEAVSTNSDIYVVSVNGSEAKNITATNKGYDVAPVYTSDGKFIVYRSQVTASFEADRWRVMVYDRQTKQAKELTVGFDLQAEEAIVSPDNMTIYFTAGERGRQTVWTVPINGGTIKKIIDEGFSSNLNLTPDGKTLIFAGMTMRTPVGIYRSTSDGRSVMGLTKVNHELLSKFNLPNPEEVEWTGALGKKIHGFLLKPANFDASKKYPLLVLIHGGPQSAWNTNWSYRWNPQVFTNSGDYVVFMPNPRGSTGYGQKFVDEISGDWGGKVYVDLMNGVAEVIKRPYIDKNRIGGAGASYGGYMVNWILGHNNDPRFKFKALVSHAGVYNLESMAGVTEELWFTNWEFKGQPWTNPAMYARWSPHKFAKNFKTPTLVIHGQLDYRVPYGEGIQLYTTLQVQNVPSKIIIFPDEGHWILKPQNSEFWYNNVLDWLGKYLKG
jgi:dipeptidyl aminopeptidase/acylaminoacyl peptidase